MLFTLSSLILNSAYALTTQLQELAIVGCTQSLLENTVAQDAKKAGKAIKDIKQTVEDIKIQQQKIFSSAQAYCSCVIGMVYHGEENVSNKMLQDGIEKNKQRILGECPAFVH